MQSIKNIEQLENNEECKRSTTPFQIVWTDIYRSRGAESKQQWVIGKKIVEYIACVCSTIGGVVLVVTFFNSQGRYWLKWYFA